jgi:hypothetical protein
MYAHVDDSGRAGFMCLAGYLDARAMLEALDYEWRELLQEYELPRFKTADFMTGQIEYSNKIKTMDERIFVLNKFCSLANRYGRYGLIISTERDAFKRALDSRKGSKNPVTFLFYRLIGRFYCKMMQLKADEPVQFVFDDSESDAQRFYSIWSKAKKFKKFARDRLSSITFSDDRMDCWIQAADLLANGIINEHPDGRTQAQNGPFKALFYEPNVPVWEHWDDALFSKHPEIIDDYRTID